MKLKFQVICKRVICQHEGSFNQVLFFDLESNGSSELAHTLEEARRNAVRGYSLTFEISFRDYDSDGCVLFVEKMISFVKQNPRIPFQISGSSFPAIEQARKEELVKLERRQGPSVYGQQPDGTAGDVRPSNLPPITLDMSSIGRNQRQQRKKCW